MSPDSTTALTVVGSSADRPARIRAALRSLVADQGLHGTSMSAIAKLAGVATGTAYVHYDSKDDLVVAAYVEAKMEMSHAGVANLDPAAAPKDQFLAIWHGVHRHLAANSELARFVAQVNMSPYAADVHREVLAHDDDPLADAVTALLPMLVPLPLTTLHDLSIGVAVRIVASGDELSKAELALLAEASWRAITSG